MIMEHNSDSDSESTDLSDFYRDAIHQLESAIEFEDGENESQDELTPPNKKSILNTTVNENNITLHVIKDDQNSTKSSDVEKLLSIIQDRDVTQHYDASNTFEPEELLEKMYSEREEKVKGHSTNTQINSTIMEIDGEPPLEKCVEKYKNDMMYHKVESVIDLTHDIPVESKIEKNDVDLAEVITQSRFQKDEIGSKQTNLNLIEKINTEFICEPSQQSVFNRFFNEVSTIESHEENTKIKQALLLTNAFHDVDNNRLKKLIKKESQKTREKYSDLQRCLYRLSSKFDKHLKSSKKRSKHESCCHKRKKYYSHSRSCSSTRYHHQVKPDSQSRTTLVQKCKSRSNSSHEDISNSQNSFSNQRSTKHTKYHSLKLYRPRKSPPSSSSPEQPQRSLPSTCSPEQSTINGNEHKKRFSESSSCSRSYSPVTRRSRKYVSRSRKYVRSSSNSSSSSSFRHKTASRKRHGSSCARSPTKSRDIQTFPSSSSTFLSRQTYQQEVRKGDNIITRQAVVTTSYKEELKSFGEKLIKVNQKYTYNDSDNNSDDSLLRLNLKVYDDNNENVTKNRPGGDFHHPFYIHPENAELYRVRTKNGTQPVQALHEICIKCNWKFPTYLNLPSEKGFKFAMIIKNHMFITEKVGQQKKLAKAEIAKVILQWLRIIDIS